MASVIRNRHHVVHDPKRSFSNFGFWWSIGAFTIGLFIIAFEPLRERFNALHPVASVLFLIGISFVAGVVMKLARDVWWLNYLLERTSNRYMYVGADTLRSWQYTLDSIWLLTRTSQKKLGRLYIQIDRTVRAEEAKRMFAAYLIDRGVLVVYSRSSKPKKMA
ncbi:MULTISPECIES: hypothetical protein [Exiguobacterium]|uniref:hypothetical protein n=1 Tax=Exiguobacterium TaxID=33986 RepID=UPI00087767E0|nr:MULTISPECIES: hypothetical protein [Exiguobacterium]TCI27232.1 hypothetical protein EVJ32_03295 [Exiguobacterium sp. SH5S4]TCI51431.1 hypothetical protein EVJ30_11235 [Exiguobacterium sp. SH5S13]TCI63911.1 hypothetical protein EVJ26_05825 [Exiguobacterium sp. SH3S1]